MAPVRGAGKRRLLHIAALLLSLVLAAVLLRYAFTGVSGANLARIISGASWPWLAAYTASIVIIHLIRAWRWQLLLGGRAAAPINSVLASLLLCYAANDVVPRSGEVLRAMAVGKAVGASSSAVIGTIVTERVYDLVTFGLCVVLSGVLFSGLLYTHFPWVLPLLWAGAALLLLLVAAMVLAAKNSTRVAAVTRRLSAPAGHTAASFISRHTLNFIKGFSLVPSLRMHAAIFGISLLLMAVYTLSTHSVFYALQLQFRNAVSLQLSLLLMCMSAIGILIPAPGGIGSVHAITVTLLAGMFAYSNDDALALAVVSHGISYLFHIVFGALAAVWLHKKHGLFPGKLSAAFSGWFR